MTNEGRSWGRWALVALLSASCAVACGDDDDDAPNGAAGSGGTAGSGGRGGTGGSGADGGLGGVGGNGGEPQAVGWCGPYPLKDFCDLAVNPCPEDLDALLARDLCAKPGALEATRLETTCGGSIIVAGYGLGSQQWEFDEEGQLIGVLNHGDALVTCETGGYSPSRLYGAEPCKVTSAEPEVVCTRGGGGEGGGGAGGGGADSVGGAPGGAGGGGGAED